MGDADQNQEKTFPKRTRRRSMCPNRRRQMHLAQRNKDHRRLSRLLGYCPVERVYKYKQWSVYITQNEYESLSKYAKESGRGMFPYVSKIVETFAQSSTLRSWFRKNRSETFLAPLSHRGMKKVQIAISGIGRQTLISRAEYIAKRSMGSYPHTIYVREMLNLFVTRIEFRERVWREQMEFTRRVRQELRQSRVERETVTDSPALKGEAPLIRLELERLLALNKNKKS